MKYGVGLSLFDGREVVLPEGMTEIDLPEHPTMQEIKDALALPVSVAWRLRRQGQEIVISLNQVQVLILVAQAGPVIHERPS